MPSARPPPDDDDDEESECRDRTTLVFCSYAEMCLDFLQDCRTTTHKSVLKFLLGCRNKKTQDTEFRNYRNSADV